MRQIKFRGKDAVTKQWVYGDLLHICGGCLIYHGSQTGYGECEYKGVQLAMDEISVVIPDTIGQFTGLHDKEGKEIYEGDIVKFDDTPYDVYARAYGGEVVMCRGCWSVKTLFYGHYMYPNLFKDDFADRKTLLLGNIHDNPELLKGGIE